MKFSARFLASLVLFSLTLAPLSAAETVTYGIFDCTFHNAGDSSSDYSSALDWTDEHKAALERALNSWASLIVNEPGRQLTVGLFWGDYGEGSTTLGSAGSSWSISYNYSTKGSTQVYTDVESVWMNGSTATSGSYDIIINFNYRYADQFYYGEEANIDIGNLLDFQSVVMHEIAHTMGFTSTARADGTFLTYTNKFTGNDFVIYTGLDALMLNEDGEDIVTIAADNLTTTGTATGFTTGETISLSGSTLDIYNPDPWQEGSSMAHVTEESDPDALMIYEIGVNTFRREMTDAELKVMSLLGWTVVPEPATATLSLLGLTALLLRRRRAS